MPGLRLELPPGVGFLHPPKMRQREEAGRERAPAHEDIVAGVPLRLGRSQDRQDHAEQKDETKRTVFHVQRG